VLAGWEPVYSFVAENVWTAAAVLLAVFGAALTAYAREEIRVGTNWALKPIARHLPWNRSPAKPLPRTTLLSVFTLVQVFLLDAVGNHARYEKTTSFVVNRPTTFYREAVTAECSATAFATMRGTIVETVIDRGFYVSKIDLANPVGEGERLTNIYSADLIQSFTQSHEHWTQEFAYPTKHFTLHIHFPAARPPMSVACKILDGTLEKPAGSAARIIELFGRKSIVWDVTNPEVDQALKLEWIW
jgi:hypothetical protein